LKGFDNDMNTQLPTTIQTDWQLEERILRTRLSGILQPEDLETWEQQLEDLSRQIPKHFDFAMLVDIRGYEVSEQDKALHQRQRVIIPTLLARHGFEVGFFRLFEVQNTISLDPERARCRVVAHVHHDCDKMALYNQAEAWLQQGSP
jgi:hypothetical protein